MNISYVFVLCCVALCKDAIAKHAHTKANHVSEDEGKIVGGYDTSIQSAPYQVYLLLKKGSQYYQCGGSIISPRYILTAAHCLTGISQINVRAGSTNASSGGKVYTTRVFRQHPRYNPRTSDFDVGFIRLNQDLTIDGTSTKAVQLAEASSTVQPGTQILVSGWGTTSENGQTSPTLQAVKVPTVSNQDCRKSYGNSITSRMFCAGEPQGGKDSCQGDSGGPAVDDSATQLGIVSFGQGCARPNFPGVYTNVASVRSWIKANTRV